MTIIICDSYLRSTQLASPVLHHYVKSKTTESITTVIQHIIEKRNLITHLWEIIICYCLILNFMSEIWNKRDHISNTLSVSDKISCPLIRYGCNENPKVFRKKDLDISYFFFIIYS
jgi:hypothetical protein